MNKKIHDWKNIEKEFNGGAILLGNGASISVWNKFNYKSLKKYATEKELLTDDIGEIFKFFKTNDFEFILRTVWQSTNVNEALGIGETTTKAAYETIRNCLISTIQKTHPEHSEVIDNLSSIKSFIKNFSFIISLNYDLLIYWAVMHELNKDNSHAFKDCFIKGGKFDSEWQVNLKDSEKNKKKCSLVFYPHGHLVLAQDKTENERKISSQGRNNSLLDSILNVWKSGNYTPLFVSEGTSEEKLKAIQNSHYLNTVYSEVLTNLPKNLTLYGWGFKEEDRHILKAIVKSDIEKMAISVHGDSQGYCTTVEDRIKNALKELKKEKESHGEKVEERKIDIKFFDSNSSGCWIKQKVNSVTLS